MAINAVLHAIALMKLNPCKEIDPRVDGTRIFSFALEHGQNISKQNGFDKSRVTRPIGEMWSLKKGEV